MEEKRVEIFSDGRPITCPTLRGIRMGLYECSKRGAVCCWGCDEFSRGGNYYYCGYHKRFGLSDCWTFRAHYTTPTFCLKFTDIYDNISHISLYILRNISKIKR